MILHRFLALPAHLTNPNLRMIYTTNIFILNYREYRQGALNFDMYRYIASALIFFILFCTIKQAHAGQIVTASEKYSYTPIMAITMVERIYNRIKHNLNFKDNKCSCGLSSKKIFNDSWHYYKDRFISDDGRVIDHQKDSITTSEGQAYAMRRALLMNDKVTFDKVYNWTKYNLKHKDDNLFAWKWGKKDIGYGIIDDCSATDAGVEIVSVLIRASKIWNQKSYLNDAKKILPDLWNKETIEINGLRILASGNCLKDGENIAVNPSYFMLNSFRLFAKVDKSHDWQKLVYSSYKLVNYCIDKIDSGLPPDWFYINKNTGKISFDSQKSDFSYDAIRIFYRFYIDYTLNNDQRAKKLLSRVNLFIDRWKKDGKFYTNYKQNGELKDYVEPIGSIALLLPIIKSYNKEVAEEIYKDRIEKFYNKDGYWNHPMDYYAQNLVWFGTWLYLDEENIKSFKY